MEVKDVLTLVFGLILFIAILYGFYWILRRWSRKTSSLSVSRYAKNIDRVVIAQDKHIEMIQVGEDVFLIGVTSSSMNLLAKINKDELVQFPKEIQESGFKDIFSQMTQKSK